jgi:hypothetical protein
MPTPDETPCPGCGGLGLVVEEVLVAQPAGTYSLAGMQPKVSARMTLRWRCARCGKTGPAVEG